MPSGNERISEPESAASTAFSRRLRGALIPAVPVMFEARGKLDAAAHDSFCRYLTSAAIDGAAVWAHTGRGLHLDSETADFVLSRWRSHLSAGRLLIAGAGSRSALTDSPDIPESAVIAEAQEMAARARRLGADLLLVYAPGRFRDHPRRRQWIKDYHRAIAEVGLPMIAFYLYEAAGGIAYSPAELEDIFSIPLLASIKIATLDSVCTFQEVTAWVQKHTPDLPILTGEDRFLGYSLLRGACGALIGMGSVHPRMQKRLIAAAASGDHRQAVRLTLLVDRLGECLFARPFASYIQRLLLALSSLEVIPEAAARDPWAEPLEEDEKLRVAQTVRELLAEESRAADGSPS